MKRYLLYLLVSLTFISFASCSDKDDPDMIWDYVPVHYAFYFHNLEGRNLLDPSTEGNILDQEIYIIRNGERIDANYGWPEPIHSRMILAEWYGVFIAPSFSHYGPDMGNGIFIGEFDGSENEDGFELVVCGNSYEIKFESHIQKDGHVERQYYMNGFEMSDTYWYVRLDENLKDINYFKK